MCENYNWETAPDCCHLPLYMAQEVNVKPGNTTAVWSGAPDASLMTGLRHHRPSTGLLIWIVRSVVCKKFVLCIANGSRRGQIMLIALLLYLHVCMVHAGPSGVVVEQV